MLILKFNKNKLFWSSKQVSTCSKSKSQPEEEEEEEEEDDGEKALIDLTAEPKVKRVDRKTIAELGSEPLFLIRA